MPLLLLRVRRLVCHFVDRERSIWKWQLCVRRAGTGEGRATEGGPPGTSWRQGGSVHQPSRSLMNAKQSPYSASVILHRNVEDENLTCEYCHFKMPICTVACRRPVTQHLLLSRSPTFLLHIIVSRSQEREGPRCIKKGFPCQSGGITAIMHAKGVGRLGPLGSGIHISNAVHAGSRCPWPWFGRAVISAQNVHCIALIGGATQLNTA